MRPGTLDRRGGARAAAGLVVLLLALSCLPADAAVVVRQRISDGVFASIRDGQHIFLECRGGDAAEQTLGPFLADQSQWSRYKGLQSVAIPLAQLNPDTQRQVLQAIFPGDVIDARGWWHTVAFSGEQGQENIHVISEWFTGHTKNAVLLTQAPENKGLVRLGKGTRILVPQALLLPALREARGAAAAPVQPSAPQTFSNKVAAAPQMKAHVQPPPAPARTPVPRGKESAALQPARSQAPVAGAVPALLNTEPPGEEGEGGAEPAQLAAGELSYGQDAQGAYAAYRLKRGEAIYTSVVARFTDFQTSDDINRACDVVLKRSGISDARNIDVGQAIRIPMEMLRDRYWPEESAERKNFDAITQEAMRLQETRVTAKGLSDVTVIIDPGHGGNDHGAMHEGSGLYEDELNYDIALRLKRLLETHTQAKVHITLTDPKQGHEPCDLHRFAADKNEELLTTPRYWNEDAKVSANLRWYLSNAIFARELKQGADPRKAVFISIHCDALHEKMRGTMIYVPGAKYRRDREQPDGVVYARYEETNNHAAVTTNNSDRTRDEALSRNFAQALIDSLQSHEPRIAVSKHGDPIRNVIRQGDGRAYVPAVLRNNLVPTKVLVETANLNNAQDRERLADPLWRQWYADALLDAIRTHFKS